MVPLEGRDAVYVEGETPLIRILPTACRRREGGSTKDSDHYSDGSKQEYQERLTCCFVVSLVVSNIKEARYVWQYSQGVGVTACRKRDVELQR
jgi:hypothetical protein